MNGIMKFGILMLLASVIANAAPVQDDVVNAAVDDIDGVYDREARSSDSASLPWHLDRIDQRSSLLDGMYSPFANATGAGVDIYVFSDGIEYDNEEFGGRALPGKFRRNFQPKESCAEHGTQLASIAAGKVYGVAKNANIYSINVLTCQLHGRFSDVLAAVRHVVKMAKRTGRRSVLAMPLIGPLTQAVNDAIEEAVEKNNIVVVTAAGNFRRNACSYSPGSSTHVINVGATRMTDGEDRLYDSSSRIGTNFGRCVSLYAPGVSITSVNGRLTGTAPACAIVSGAAALILEKYPHYTPAEVKQHLINSATDGAINIISQIYLREDRQGRNKLLYVGHELDDIEIDEASGSGNGDLIQPLS